MIDDMPPYNSCIKYTQIPLKITFSSKPAIFTWYSGKGFELPVYCPETKKNKIKVKLNFQPMLTVQLPGWSQSGVLMAFFRTCALQKKGTSFLTTYQVFPVLVCDFVTGNSRAKESGLLDFLHFLCFCCYLVHQIFLSSPLKTSTKQFRYLISVRRQTNFKNSKRLPRVVHVRIIKYFSPELRWVRWSRFANVARHVISVVKKKLLLK